MDRNFCVNQVFRDLRSDRLFRILWIDPGEGDAYIYWLDGKATIPVHAGTGELEEGIKQGWLAEAEDPYKVPVNASAEEKEHRDQLWARMKSALLDEPGIYRKKIRAEHLRRIQSESGEQATNLYRHLGRYWQRGKTPDAFLPGYRASGGKGKTRLGRALPEGSRKSEFGKTLVPEDMIHFETAIRKYYLTRKEPDLSAVYDRLLEDSYTVTETGPDGKETAHLLPKGEVPSLRQFRYWYSKTRDIREEVSRRKGETAFELTSRAVTGKNDFGMMGPGSQYQVDATVADIYLVSRFERSDIIGRPVVYFVMDVFSRIVTGMYIGLEGPSWAGMMMALYNATTDKVDFCHQYGIEITEEMWPCHHVPAVLLGDRGELESHRADNLVSMLGIRVDNAPPYRGDLKPVIESHFKTINQKVSPVLPGWVMKDQAKRGGKDYRLDAKLDLQQFTRVIINCVIHYNNRHYLKDFEKNEQMLKTGVEAVPVKLWEWGIRNCSGCLRTYPDETIRLALMPKDTGSVTEKGIYFKKLYYTCPQARQEQWFEKARKDGRYKVEISYDPRDMGKVFAWHQDGSAAYECILMDWEQRFGGKSEDEVHYEQVKQDMIRSSNERAEKEAEINLNRIIDAIVSEAEQMAPSTAGKTKAERLAGIKENRKKEKEVLREEEAFTAEPGKEAPSGMAGAPQGQEWEELTPIQKMLWKDLERRRAGDESSQGSGGIPGAGTSGISGEPAD